MAPYTWQGKRRLAEKVRLLISTSHVPLPAGLRSTPCRAASAKQR